MIAAGKYIVTFWLCMSFVSVGCVFNIIGPTLFDLAAKTQVHVTIISLVFLTQGIGIFIGTATSGGLFARFNHKLLLCAISVICATSTAICGWSDSFILVAMMFFVQGVAVGSIEGGGLIHCLYVWQEASSGYLHFVMAGLGIGSIICPLLVSPYLSEFSRNMTKSPSMSFIPIIEHNMTNHIIIAIKNASNPGRSNCSTVDMVITHEGRVEYAYYMVSGTLLVTAAAYFMTLISGTGLQRNNNLEIRNDLPRNHFEDDVTALYPDNNNVITTEHCLYPTRCIKFLANLMTTFVAGNQNVYGNLIPIYFVESGLGLQTGTYLTSAFWVIFTVSRFLCCFLVHFTGSKKILTLCITLANVGSVCLFFRSFSNAFLLIAIINFALGTSAIFPGLMGWVKETVNITPIDIAILLSSACVGHMAWTVGISIAMEKFGSVVFDYVVMGTNFSIGICWFVAVVKQCCYRENLEKQMLSGAICGAKLNERSPLLVADD
ncbi:major facilitator superfamily domain-containing protein 4A-like [Tubulanus polymorphus]|uniref:major facilitator superfamily domain-containing protein 4A-like n=1 Tax=Tubulanus polymorphus TaxID=672921 RepID=UPI003DA335BB